MNTDTQSMPVALSQAVSGRVEAPAPKSDQVARFQGYEKVWRNGAVVMRANWHVLPLAECEAAIDRMTRELDPVGSERGVQLARQVVGAYPQNPPPDPTTYAAAIANAFASQPSCIATETARLILEKSKWRPAVADVIEIGERLAQRKRRHLCEAKQQTGRAYGDRDDPQSGPDEVEREAVRGMMKKLIEDLKAAPGPQA